MFNLLTLFDSIFNDLFLCKNLRLRGWKNRKIGAGVEKKTEEVFLKGNGNLEVKGFETGGYRRERTECSLNRENTSEPFSYVLSLSPSRNKNLNRIETVWQISSRDIHPPLPSCLWRCRLPQNHSWPQSGEFLFFSQSSPVYFDINLSIF